MTVGFVIAVLGSACATRPRAAAAPTPSAAPSTRAHAEPNPDEADDGSEDPARATMDSSETADGDSEGAAGPCPTDMALIEVSTPTPRRFCVDKYEASLVEVLPDGTERAFPHYVTVDGHDVRAVSRPHSFPQGFISEVQAQDACGASGKRLCNLDEWKTACTGPTHTTFPYGDARRPGACHDTGKSAVLAVFGAKAVAASMPARAAAPASASPVASHANGKHAHVTKGRAAHATRPRASAAKTATKIGAGRSGAAPVPAWAAAKASSKKLTRRTTGKKSSRPSTVDAGVWAHLNDPALGQVDGALAKTGEHAECANGFGVFDMVGNLHEWIADVHAGSRGTFSGGYYQDTHLNGDGCSYRTVAHDVSYHDYSTGFRCCADAR